MADNHLDNDDRMDFIDEDLDIVDDLHEKQSRTSLDGYDANDVLVYEGKKYAVGLTWLTVDEIEQPGAIMDRAKMISADFLSSRLFIAQTGYGYLNKGHRMGMPSVAAIIADALVGEWHGVFVADNGWLYVAVHADTIAPDGDILFETEEEAYNHFMIQAERFKWPKTYVPETWNVDNNDGEIILNQLLDEGSFIALKPVNLDGLFSGSANKNIAFVCLLGFIIISFLTFFSEDFFESLFPKHAEINQPVLEMNSNITIPPKTLTKENDPFFQALENFKIPDPNKVLEVCVNSFGDLMVPLPGWNVARMRCRNGFVEAVWRKGRGNINTLKPYLNQFPFGVSTTVSSSGDFIASLIMKNNSNYGQKIQLANREDILITLNDRFSKIGRLEVRDVVPQNQNERSTGGARRFKGRNSDKENNNKQYTVEDLPSLDVILTTKSPPQNFVNYFTIPGLKFKTIEWGVDGGTWVYNIQIYLAMRDGQVKERIN